jgi:hypothetical protein
MVTGRELDDLQQVFQHLDLFDRVVAEQCQSSTARPINDRAEVPPQAFIDALHDRGVTPLSVGP